MCLLCDLERQERHHAAAAAGSADLTKPRQSRDLTDYLSNPPLLPVCVCVCVCLSVRVWHIHLVLPARDARGAAAGGRPGQGAAHHHPPRPHGTRRCTQLHAHMHACTIHAHNTHLSLSFIFLSLTHAHIHVDPIQIRRACVVTPQVQAAFLEEAQYLQHAVEHGSIFNMMFRSMVRRPSLALPCLVCVRPSSSRPL